MLCLELDIRSCFNFRQANRRARQVVSGLYEYRTLAQNALETVRAVLRTSKSLPITISDLYRTLCDRRCAVCDAGFGAFFLLSAIRCCYMCLEFAPELCVVLLAALSKTTHLSRKRLERLLPVLRTVPGSYRKEETRNRCRLTATGIQRFESA